MLRCDECEFFRRDSDGTPILTCDPFSTVREVHCLAKWELVHLQSMRQYHQSTMQMHSRLAPLQEKMIKHVEREIADAEEADKWKHDDEDGEENPFHT